jgi:hypothetical protein
MIHSALQVRFPTLYHPRGGFNNRDGSLQQQRRLRQLPWQEQVREPRRID